jgi:hypothetical protein
MSSSSNQDSSEDIKEDLYPSIPLPSALGSTDWSVPRAPFHGGDTEKNVILKIWEKPN